MLANSQAVQTKAQSRIQQNGCFSPTATTRGPVGKLSQSRDDEGFAIVLVILAMALLAAIASTFAVTSTINTQVTINLVQNLQAQALADGGARLVALELERQRRGDSTRLVRNAQPFFCQIEGYQGASLRLVAADAGGKIDLNSASRALLLTFFAGLSGTQSEAEIHVDRLIDFRDVDSIARRHGAELGQHRQAGLGYGPKNGLLSSIEDLEQVLGVPTSIYKRALPFVTVHGRQSGIDVQAASPSLLELLRNGLNHIGNNEPVSASGLPLNLLAASQRRAFEIKSTAFLPTGLRFTREATVELVERGTEKFAFRRWMQGTLTGKKLVQKPQASWPVC